MSYAVTRGRLPRGSQAIQPAPFHDAPPVVRGPGGPTPLGPHGTHVLGGWFGGAWGVWPATTVVNHITQNCGGDMHQHRRPPSFGTLQTFAAGAAIPAGHWLVTAAGDVTYTVGASAPFTASYNVGAFFVADDASCVAETAIDLIRVTP